MIEYDPAGHYLPQDLVMPTFIQNFQSDAWFRGLEDRGHLIVVDHLLDSDVDTPSRRLSPRKLELRNGNWMWYNTALRDALAGYDRYRPCVCYTHDFLCLMNKERYHRDRIMQDLAAELAHARWSYVERGHMIGDPEERNTSVFWEFYMNPQWYDSTCWHLVVESWMRGDAWFANPEHPNYKTEISEKIYKPLAWFQPFVVAGSVDTLAFLRRQGFETFDNLWPETYDSIPGDVDRLDHVIAHVKDLVRTYNRHWSGWDPVTQQKLEHNHARYFNLDLIRQRFRDEILEELLEFAAL